MERLINVETVPAADLADNIALSYANLSAIDVQGLDIEARYRPSLNTLFVLSASFMSASTDEDQINIFVGREEIENSVPSYSGSLFAMHEFADSWTLSGTLSWVDEMLWLDSRDMNDGYTRLDLRLAKSFRVKDIRGEFSIQGQNLGDRYADFDEDQFFERRLFASLKIEI